MGKPKYIQDPSCSHEDYAKERHLFGGQKSGDFQCNRCGYVWDPKNPPQQAQNKDSE